MGPSMTACREPVSPGTAPQKRLLLLTRPSPVPCALLLEFQWMMHLTSVLPLQPHCSVSVPCCRFCVGFCLEARTAWYLHCVLTFKHGLYFVLFLFWKSLYPPESHVLEEFFFALFWWGRGRCSDFSCPCSWPISLGVSHFWFPSWVLQMCDYGPLVGAAVASGGWWGTISLWGSGPGEASFPSPGPAPGGEFSHLLTAPWLCGQDVTTHSRSELTWC